MYRLGLVLLGLAACGDEPARISLAPVEVPESTCGRPADARSLLVTAQGEFIEDVRSVELDGAIEIADFPPGTRQLVVEVLGAGGVVRAFGRSAPLELDGLGDGDVVRVFMAPPDDGCPVASMAEARDRPLVIPAGDGALVLGGRGVGGFLGTAEWYDPATGAFTPVETPQAYTTSVLGATGVAAAPLPDGRIVLIGGHRPVYTIFDPADRTFTTPGGLFEVRAHHAAVALDADRVLVVGGCGQLAEMGAAAGECLPGTAQLRSFVLDLRDGALVDGPSLALERIRPGAVREDDRVLVIGGHDDAGAAVDAERIDPGGGAGATMPGAGGVAAVLASGSAVAGFAAEGAAAGGDVAVLVPGIDEARPQGGAPPRSGPTLTGLEDGEVLIVGGADSDVVARYRPAAGAVVATAALPVDLAGAPLGRAGHGAARLPDGSVLVVGGRDEAGQPLAGAWVYRPAGDGPFTSAVSVTPASDATVPLVPFDPAAVTLAPEYQLAAPGWVVIAGMQPRSFDLGATVRIEGGLALLFGFADPGHFDAVELVDGAAARVVRRDGGAPVELCRGDAIDVPDGPVALAATLRGADLEIALGGGVVLACDLGEARAGRVGLAAVGTDARVTLSTVSVTR